MIEESTNWKANWVRMQGKSYVWVVKKNIISVIKSKPVPKHIKCMSITKFRHVYPMANNSHSYCVLKILNTTQ